MNALTVLAFGAFEGCGSGLKVFNFHPVISI